MPEVGLQPRVDGYEVLLAYNDRALSDAGATFATNLGETGGFVLSNLGEEGYDLPWRSDSIAALGEDVGYVDVFLDSGLVDIAILLGNNLREPWRATLYDQADSQIAQSAWTSPIVRGNFDDFATFASFEFGLGVSEEELAALRSQFLLRSPVFFDSPAPARRIRIEMDFSGGTNGGADYVQMGAIFAGRIFRPLKNMAIGWSVGGRSRAELIRPDSGTLLGFEREDIRDLELTFDRLTKPEAFERIYQDLAGVGTLGRVFYWALPDHPRYFYQTSGVGTLEALPRVTSEPHNSSAEPLVIVETL